MHVQTTIGFGFTSDWLKKWSENFEPITEFLEVADPLCGFEEPKWQWTSTTAGSYSVQCFSKGKSTVRELETDLFTSTQANG